MRTLDPISSKVVLYQSLPTGQAKEDLFNEIYKAVYGLMVWHLPAYAKASQQDQDLLQEMSIQLLTALDRFNVEKGVKFSTYFCFYIKLAINKFYANGRRVIQIPYESYVNHIDWRPKVMWADKQLTNGKKSDTALSDQTYWDILKIDTNYEKEFKNLELRMDFEKIKFRLKPQELQVVLWRMEGLTLEEIGQKLDVTQEYIRLIEIDAFDMLKHGKRINKLKEYERKKTLRLKKRRKKNARRNQSKLPHIE
jgi:RNA polymerase sigma factor (sigma-70 family)